MVPAYNRAHRLPDAIDSVVRQGQDDVEIVVVDDGSVDDTRDVCARYGRVVKYVYQDNAGVGAARNTGIRHTTGDFVAFRTDRGRYYSVNLAVNL